MNGHSFDSTDWLAEPRTTPARGSQIAPGGERAEFQTNNQLTTMKLQRKSLLIKWAYLPEIILCDEPEIPLNTDLCTILGRAMFGSVMFVCVAMPIGCVLMAVLYPVCWLHDVPGLAIEKWWKTTVIRAAIKDWKNKTCTMVQIVDSPAYHRKKRLGSYEAAIQSALL